MVTFSDLGLSESLLKAIEKLGFETPTNIQLQAIPQLLNEKRDLIAIAQTGTGKTAAFGLPLLQNVDTKNDTVQAIVLCPTRELCLQLAKDLNNYAKFNKAEILAVYGGTDISAQIKVLRRGVHVVVGTPGRTLDLIKRKKLNLEDIKYVVLDEADEMLSMGFKDELDAILSFVPEVRQTLFFSATMPSEIRNLAKKYMNDPANISVGSENRNNKNVSHVYFNTTRDTKYSVLKRIIDSHVDIYGIVFCRTRAETKEIAEKLTKEGYNAEAIHGELSQQQRDNVMNKFRKKQIQLLIATDVAARGIDVESLTHVINYNLPDESEVYVHRSGRTGRAGNVGESIVLLSGRDKSKLGRVERHINTKFTEGEIPSSDAIIKSKMEHYCDDLLAVEVNEDFKKYHLDEIMAKFSDVDKDTLVQKLLTQEFNSIFDYYQKNNDKMLKSSNRGNRSDRNSRNPGDQRDGRRDSRRDGRKDRGRGSSIKFSKFYINVGKKEKATPKTIFQLINRYLPKKDVEVGNITIKNTHSFFELDSSYEKQAIKALKNAKYRSKKLFVEVTD